MEHSANIDLILSDIVMPGMSGIQMAEQIHRMNPDQQFLFMSGYNDMADSTIDCLPNPFTVTDLTSRIRAFFEEVPKTRHCQTPIKARTRRACS